jgi:hypothetical protein
VAVLKASFMAFPSALSSVENVIFSGCLGMLTNILVRALAAPYPGSGKAMVANGLQVAHLPTGPVYRR